MMMGMCTKNLSNYDSNSLSLSSLSCPNYLNQQSLDYASNLDAFSLMVWDIVLTSSYLRPLLRQYGYSLSESIYSQIQLYLLGIFNSHDIPHLHKICSKSSAIDSPSSSGGMPFLRAA